MFYLWLLVKPENGCYERYQSEIGDKTTMPITTGKVIFKTVMCGASSYKHERWQNGGLANLVGVDLILLKGTRFDQNIATRM